MSTLDKVSTWLDNPNDEEDLSDLNDNLGLCLPPELMRGGSAPQLFSDCSTLHKRKKADRSRKKADRSQDELKEYSDKFYKIVLDTIGGDDRKLSNHQFSDRELETIVESLQYAGFNVSYKDYDDIIKVAKTIRNGKITVLKSLMSPDSQYRHASLNCYDYDRLKEEMERLTDDIGYKNIDREAPTLSSIYVDAVKGEEEPYPCRHLPFNKIKGRTAWRYQCLRIMDEILCTSEERMTNDRMRQEIIIKAEQYGIHRENDITVTDSSLKKLYAILSELINVEHTWGNKIKYDSSVYVDGRAGHLYKGFKDGRRLSAFTVDISGLEAWKLRKEIGMIRVKYFYDDIAYFKEKFPLLSVLGYLDNLLLEENVNPDINNVSHTDFVTVNYRLGEYSDLKQKVEGAILMHLPIFVNIESKVEKIIPVKIREDRGKWGLIAKDAVSSQLRIITAEQLSRSFDIDSNHIDDDDSSQLCDHVIGIKPLLIPELKDVTLEVTVKGLEDIHRKDSVFCRMKPKIEYVKVPSYAGEKYIRGSRVSFSLYINEDFLSELFSLDRKAMLLTVMPDEVNKLYEEYYENQMGSKRQHPRDRAQSMKRIKIRKNME